MVDKWKTISMGRGVARFCNVAVDGGGILYYGALPREGFGKRQNWRYVTVE